MESLKEESIFTQAVQAFLAVVSYVRNTVDKISVGIYTDC